MKTYRNECSTLYALSLFAAMVNSFQLHSQNEIEIRDLDKPFFMIFDSLASGLDTSVIPGGILYNRVMPWSNLEESQDEDTLVDTPQNIRYHQYTDFIDI